MRSQLVGQRYLFWQFLLAAVLSIGVPRLGHGQEEENQKTDVLEGLENLENKTDDTVDSLSTNILEAVFKDEPATVSNQKTDSTKKVTINAFPYVFYTPESKFAGGAGGIILFYTGDEPGLKPSKVGFGGYYSTNKQYKISVGPTLYFFGNSLYIDWPTSIGFFVNKFYGIGDDTQDIPNTSYQQKTFSSTFTIQVPPEFFYADRTGLIIDYDDTQIVDKLDNELLRNDSLPGANGGKLLGFGSDLVWDSRDNIFFPNTGGYQYFKVIIYPNIGDYVFANLELDVKGFRAFSPDHVLAVNMYVQSAIGDTPFYKLPALGGQKRMRGYFNGRYRDNFYGTVQMEYRQYFWKRFGFVVFGGFGNVSNNLIEYSFNNLKYSYGAGLRFKFNEKQKVNLRMDLGFGNEGTRGIYFGIQEAF